MTDLGLAGRRGCIVSTASISARSSGSAGSAFVATFAKSLAAELAPQGIRVDAVSPGTILTRFHEVCSSPEKLETTRRRIPLGPLGTPDDCAGALIWLASERLAAYVRGSSSR